jgi:hypothetical protein
VPIEFVDPRPPRAEPVITPAAPRRPRRGNRPPVIGMLANGFPDSERFLHHVGVAIRDARVPHAEFRVVTKSSPPVPLTAAQFEALASCDGVIAAYGH